MLRIISRHIKERCRRIRSKEIAKRIELHQENIKESTLFIKLLKYTWKIKFWQSIPLSLDQNQMKLTPVRVAIRAKVWYCATRSRGTMIQTRVSCLEVLQWRENPFGSIPTIVATPRHHLDQRRGDTPAAMAGALT